MYVVQNVVIFIVSSNRECGQAHLLDPPSPASSVYPHFCTSPYFVSMGKEYRLTTGNTSIDVGIFTGNILGYGLWRQVRSRASEKDWLSFVLWEGRASPAFCHSCEPNSEASHGNYWNAYPNCKFVARKKKMILTLHSILRFHYYL